jgi:hypothetical protein
MRALSGSMATGAGSSSSGAVKGRAGKFGATRSRTSRLRYSGIQPAFRRAPGAGYATERSREPLAKVGGACAPVAAAVRATGGLEAFHSKTVICRNGTKLRRAPTRVSGGGLVAVDARWSCRRSGRPRGTSDSAVG